MTDYFRRRSRRPVNVDWGRHVREDAERADQVLWALLGINVLVFVLWHASRGSVLQELMATHFLVSLESLASWRVWTIVTASVSHLEPGHLIFNLIGLWAFGRDLGRALGWKTLLNLYVVGGVAANVGHVLYSIGSGDLSPTLGASGAVMAVAVVYGAMWPNREILFNFFIPVPAAVLVGAYVLLDVLGVLGAGSGVANAAHLAGAAYGLAWWWFRVR